MKRMIFLLVMLLLSITTVSRISSQTTQKVGDWAITLERRWWDTTFSYVNVKALAVANGVVFAGTPGENWNNSMPVAPLYISKDTGKTWIPRGKANGLDLPLNTVWSLCAIDSSTVLLGAGGGIYKTTNGGDSWVRIYNEPSSYVTMIRKTHGDTIFASGSRLIRSIDNGNTWAIVDSSVVMGITETPSGVLVAAAGHMATPERAKGILRSTDGGNTWYFSNDGLPSKNVVDVSAWPSGFSPEVYGVTMVNGAVYSPDEGKTWMPMPQSAGINLVEGEVVKATSSLGVFIGGYGGYDGISPLYWSRTGGLSNWVAIDLNPRRVDVGCLEEFNSNILLIGTWDGVWIARFDHLTSVQESSVQPSNFRLFQNHPNPFNPTTTIEFQIPERVFVKLSIFNTLGQEIETFVNEEKQAGTHRIQFNGSNLSSGIYFYRLETSKFVETKKMILLK